jgi:hypothetical protein
MSMQTLKTQSNEFSSIQSARKYLEQRISQYQTLPISKLHAHSDGSISHCDTESSLQTASQNLPLTDIALRHFNRLMGIPQTYANRIDPDLLAYSLNRQAKSYAAIVTLVIEWEKTEPDKKWIKAILPSEPLGIQHDLILRQLEAWELNAFVRISNGAMDVIFGDPEIVEVLPGDLVQMMGRLHNIQWGGRCRLMRPSLDVGVYLLRLACINGAYARRVIAEEQFLEWASQPQIQEFLNQQIQRVLDFPKTILQQAIWLMHNTIPQDWERDALARLLSRAIGVRRTEELLQEPISWWEHMNVITTAANQIQNLERKRHLQIEGGNLLERFLAGE